jgi:hypothetical protein
MNGILQSLTSAFDSGEWLVLRIGPVPRVPTHGLLEVRKGQVQA